MTQLQLDSAVALATGESLHTIHDRGFSLLTIDSDEQEPEDLALRLDCPFCRRTVSYPGVTADGAMAMAECLACDVYFEAFAEDVYAG